MSLDDLYRKLGALENILASKYVTPEVTVLEARLNALESSFAGLTLLGAGFSNNLFATKDADWHELDISATLGVKTSLFIATLWVIDTAGNGRTFTIRKPGIASTQLTCEPPGANNQASVEGFTFTNSSGVIEYQAWSTSTVYMYIKAYKNLD